MSSFTISAFNVNGLFGKTEQVASLLFPDGPADVLFVSEAGVLQDHYISSPRLLHLVRAPPRSHRSKSFAVFCSSRIRPHLSLIPTSEQLPAIAVRFGNICIVGCYFSPSWDKAQCTEMLNSLLDLTSSTLPFILAGDLNMRLGLLTGDSYSSRLHLHRQLLENNFSRHTSTTIPTHTCFTHGSTSTIDHIYSRNIQVGPVQVIDTQSGSDHFAVVANFPLLGGVSLQEPIPSKQLDTRKLQDNKIAKDFKTAVTNRLEGVGNRLAAWSLTIAHRTQQESQTRIDNAWQAIQDALFEAAAATLGFRRTVQPKKRWCNSPTYRQAKTVRENAFRLVRNTQPDNIHYEERWQAFRVARKAAKIALQQAFEKSKQARWLKWSSLPPPELLKVVSRLYKARRSGTSSTALRADEEALEQYAQYFEHSFSNDLVQPQDTHDDQPWSYQDFPPAALQGSTWSGSIAVVIRKLARGKATGEDGLPAEVYQAGGVAIVKALAMLFSIIARAGLIPSQWKIARLIPLFKKGNKSDISNYRPISITPIVRKIYEQCILQQVSKSIEPLSTEQGGFRAHRSTLDQAAAFDLLLQREQTNGICAVLLDIQKAYDSVALPLLWKRLAIRNTDKNLLNILVQLFRGCKSQVIIAGVKSREIQHTAGVLQGSSLSPLLYAVYIDDIVRRINLSGLGFEIAGRKFSILLYADDMVVLARTHKDAQLVLDIASQHAADMRYRFNVDKCEHLVPSPGQPSLKIGGREIPQRARVTYLGFPFRVTGLDTSTLIEEAGNRVKQRLAIFRAIGVRNTGAPPIISIKIIKAFLRPVLEYGLAIATPTNKLRHQLDQLMHRCFTTALGVQHSTSFAALQLLGRQPSFNIRWKWLASNYAVRASRATPDQTAHYVWQESIRPVRRVSASPLAIALRSAKEWPQILQARTLAQRLLVRRAWTFDYWSSRIATPNKPIQNSWSLPNDAHTSSRIIAYRLFNYVQHRLVILWRIGRFTGDPPPCKNCNTPNERATRSHLNVCRKWSSLFPTNNVLKIGQTHLDIALNTFEETGNAEVMARAAGELESIWRILHFQTTLLNLSSFISDPP